jgi:hypothetical protein
MIKDHSLFEGQLKEPLTPTEKQLKMAILYNRELLNNKIFEESQKRINISKSMTDEYIENHLDEFFYSFVETYYPIDTPDMDKFTNHCSQKLVDKVKKNYAYQSAYYTNWYKHVENPVGKVFMQYPEVDTDKDQVISFH